MANFDRTKRLERLNIDVNWWATTLAERYIRRYKITCVLRNEGAQLINRIQSRLRTGHRIWKENIRISWQPGNMQLWINGEIRDLTVKQQNVFRMLWDMHEKVRLLEEGKLK